MPDIDITRRHGLSDEAAARVEIEQLARDLIGRFGGNWRWQGDVAICDIRGARGEVSCKGDRVRMQVTLPLLMKAFRGVLEREINERFAERFSAPD